MDDIKTWLDSQDKEYAQGVSLLAKYHKNRILIKNFSNGNPAFHFKKLEYELKKLIGIPLTVLFAENTPKPNPTCVSLALFPDVIRQAKNTVYELFTTISIMHRQLFELGESNSDDVVRQRKELIEKRLPLIQRYEQIYLLKEQYFNTGVIPVELPLLINDNSEIGTQGHSQSHTDNFQSLSGVELMRKKQAIMVAIGKIQNRLKYQSLTKAEQPNPMPASPLRDKLEAKLTVLQEDLKKILQLIDEKK